MTPTPQRNRLILWYCLAIGSVGALHPFLSLVLRRRGAGPTETTLLLALFPLGLLIAGPVWGWLADRSPHGTRVIASALAVATAGSVVLLIPGSYLVLVPGLALLALSRSGAISLTDVYTLSALGGGEAGRRSYGRVRMWGSICFIAAVQGVGLLAGNWPDASLFVHAGLVVSLAVLTLTMRAEPSQAAHRTPTPLKALLLRPALVRLFLISFLHVAAMSSYDNLFALHGNELGLSDGMIGAAFGLGVGAEVIVLFLSPALLTRFSPRSLIAAAVLSGVPRWWITGAAESHLMIIAVQALHGATFGLWWVGGVAFVSQQAPIALRSSAQAIFVASGFGLGNLAALVAASITLASVGTALWFQGLAGVSLLAVLFLPWALQTAPDTTSSDAAA